MNKKPVPTIVALLAMPSVEGLDDFEFEKIDSKAIDESRIAELMKDLSEDVSKKPTD